MTPSSQNPRGLYDRLAPEFIIFLWSLLKSSKSLYLSGLAKNISLEYVLSKENTFFFQDFYFSFIF